jgi:lysophospholipase L1-like esterase
VNQGGRSPARIPWRVILPVLAAVLLGTAGAGIFAARHFYLQRAELRLAPVNTGHYLRENAGLGPKRHRRVVFFGDSRISQWRVQPAATDAELLWRGVDGETTAQMTFRFRQDVVGIGADAVIMQAGINDLVAGAALGRGPETAAAALRHIGAMVDTARAGSIDVHLLTVIRPAAAPPWRRLVWSGSIVDDVDRVNAGLRALVRPGVSLLEADRALAGDARALPRRYASDTLHLNAAGYAVLNALVAPVLTDASDAVQ